MTGYKMFTSIMVFALLIEVSFCSFNFGDNQHMDNEEELKLDQMKSLVDLLQTVHGFMDAKNSLTKNLKKRSVMDISGGMDHLFNFQSSNDLTKSKIPSYG